VSIKSLDQDAVLRVGEVSGVDGRRIYVLVDRNKNLSEMFFDGDILRNISVNSFIEIRKGFISIIGRVEGERTEEDSAVGQDGQRARVSRRVLTISLAGYLDESGFFFGGTKELPLIGNEAYIVTRSKMQAVHNLVRSSALSISVATTEDFPIALPVDGLFNSHIAIFGNTGSGKSNTLAALYQAFTSVLAARNNAAFRQRARFAFFDFNGEYAGANCIANEKTVYNLSTRRNDGDKVPLTEDALLDIEVLSILADATDKTQKPFLRRALRFLNHVQVDVDEPIEYVRNVIRKRIRSTLQMSDKVRASLLIDYFKELLPADDADGEAVDIESDIEWHNGVSEYFIKGTNTYLQQNPNAIEQTVIFQHAANYQFPESLVSRLIDFLYLQLAGDVLANRAMNEHIAPVINRLKAKQQDIDKLFDYSPGAQFWVRNVVVVNLDDVNLDMKKTIPLLLVKRLYAEQKRRGGYSALNIIVDEAHNILSKESFREAESWKDYRLETFEEVIKEGRKFGVFLTIASQRPSDISATLISQAHNYFIHRLVNEDDLRMIASAVSYIDRVTEEAIPTLPTGTCIFSGVANQMPMKIAIRPLELSARPQSHTRRFCDVVPSDVAG
jgi:uncharacterized protein